MKSVLAPSDWPGYNDAPETVNEILPMRRAILLIVLVLGGCGSIPSTSEQGLVDQAGWRHQQALQDVEAIIAGMNQARAQSERIAKQAR